MNKMRLFSQPDVLVRQNKSGGMPTKERKWALPCHNEHHRWADEDPTTQEHHLLLLFTENATR